MQKPHNIPETLSTSPRPTVPAEVANHILALMQGDAKARINAATLLGALETSVLGEEGLTFVVSTLLNAMSDEDAAVRFSVILALGDLRDPAAVYPLVDLLNSNDQGNQVRPACAWALGNIGDLRALPGLKAVLDDADEFVRAQTVQTLGKMKDLTSEENLLFALADTSDPVRSEAAETIGLLGLTAAVPKLIECLNDKSAWVRRNAAGALAKIGNAQALAALFEVLDNLDSSAAWAVVNALGDLGDSAAVPILLRALKHGKDAVREVAAWSLGRVADIATVPALIEALDDASRGTRLNAARALLRIGDAQTLPLRILASPAISPSGKLETLQMLSQVRFRSGVIHLHYSFVVDEYCRNLLTIPETESEAMAGAKAVLHEIMNREYSHTLVRATTTVIDGAELMRPVSGDDSAIIAEEQLRPSEPPSEKTEKPGLLKRLFRLQ